VWRFALLTFGVMIAAVPAAWAQSEPASAPTTESATAQQPLTTSAWAEAAKMSPERRETSEDGVDTAQDPDAPRRTRLQLGVSLKGTVSPGSDTDSSLKPTFVWRWRGRGSRIDDRLSPAYRLSSYSTVAHSQFLNQDFEIGEVKVRPLMLGLDYKMPRGKWNWAAGFSLGWAMNNVEVPWQMRAIAETAGTQDLWVDVHNSLVWGPRLKGWYDVNDRLSYMVESAYLVTRPELDVRANGVTTSRRLNADAFILKAGIVYGIW
jgi:hypothetical protein